MGEETGKRRINGEIKPWKRHAAVSEGTERKMRTFYPHGHSDVFLTRLRPRERTATLRKRERERGTWAAAATRNRKTPTEQSDTNPIILSIPLQPKALNFHKKKCPSRGSSHFSLDGKSSRPLLQELTAAEREDSAEFGAFSLLESKGRLILEIAIWLRLDVSSV